MFWETYILYYTKILKVNLFAFAYRLFHEDFSSIVDWREIFMKQSAGKCKQINFKIFVHKSSPSSTLPLVIPEYIWVIYSILYKVTS